MQPELKGRIADAVIRGIPLKEIAKKVFISEHQLKLLLKEWGIILPGKKRKRIEIPDREELMRSYQKYGTTEKVAIEFKTSIGTVNRWMKKLKIPTRRMKKMGDVAKISFLEEHLEKLGNVQF